MGNFLSGYLPALLWAGLTAAALLMPGDALRDAGGWIEVPEWLEPWADKLVHFGLFLVLALLVWRASQKGQGGSGFGGLPIAATLLYVVVLELAQTWIPGRGFEPLDMLAGFGGVLLAQVLSRLGDPRARV